MEKLKAYGAIFLFGISCFTYGGYVFGVLNCNKTVEIHQWILTGGFGLMFLIYGVNKIKTMGK